MQVVAVVMIILSCLTEHDLKITTIITGTLHCVLLYKGNDAVK